jgi:hypothetical protein
MKDLILSDSAYLVFAGLTLSALLLIERYKWDERRPITAGLLVAMLMLCAYGTRAIGGALAVAFVLHELTVKRRIRTFAVIVLGGFFAGVVALSITLYDSRTYGTEFLILPKVYLQNAMFYLRAPAALWTGAPAAVRSLLFVLTAVVVTGQWVRRMVTRPTVVEFQDLVLVCTLIVLTAGNSARYLLPFFAMYFIYFFEGIEWLRVRLPVGAGLAVAAGALLIIGTIFNIRGAVPGAFRAGVEQPAFTELAGFVRQNVDPDALVVSWNPRVLALYTDRRSAWYPRTADDAAFDSYLERTGASFVLVYLAGEEDARWVVPHIARQPAHFLAIFRNADFVLYRNTSSASN